MTQLFGGNNNSGSSSPHSHDRKLVINTPGSSHSGSGSSGGGGFRFGSSSPSPSNNSNHNVAAKLRNFFRINSSSSEGLSGNSSNGHLAPPGSNRPKSRFLRGRSTSSASQLDSAADLSPTANANPYFAHQGQPELRHHDSAGSSPPDTPGTPKQQTATIAGAMGAAEKSAASGKEEMARKLRRVASAPNAQGLFSKGAKNHQAAEDAEEVPPLPDSPNPTPNGAASLSSGNLLVPADLAVQRLRGQSFRRTYSSNSIKVRNVEVGPGSFEKIKLLGKGDVGKVYLVREKKSARLYAMKGALFRTHDELRLKLANAWCSVE